MLGFVSQEKYEAEHDARVRAEAREEALREQVTTLTQLLRDLNNGQADLLDRVLPKPDTKPVVTGNGVSHLSEAEIMSIPAVGRAGIKARARLASEARAREAQEKKEKTLQDNRESLTEEELALVDKKLEME